MCLRVKHCVCKWASGFESTAGRFVWSANHLVCHNVTLICWNTNLLHININRPWKKPSWSKSFWDPEQNLIWSSASYTSAAKWSRMLLESNTFVQYYIIPLKKPRVVFMCGRNQPNTETSRCSTRETEQLDRPWIKPCVSAVQKDCWEKKTLQARKYSSWRLQTNNNSFFGHKKERNQSKLTRWPFYTSDS